MQDTNGKVILSLLAGATAGIIVGLLLAPETGDEARADIKQGATKLNKDLARLLKEGKAKLDQIRGGNPADSEQHRTDRSAADDLLGSLSRSSTGPQPSESGLMPGSDSDYDGAGSDSRHAPGHYKS
ncbi:hypothetical protein CDA63_09255 [Hymenobacter amundsenii]|uniref:YtxH domain-containing protein n=1 Tax=Hymenobacter amundsenii TaxID=2006685 RepID=A0A246FKY8_9BACT|nr:YtxH domain-containing protein [Hymenobacter amundsenii]OWP63383.1 hypothetical protein CDA63_09255 [Hymenobacter amundsenii]